MPPVCQVCRHPQAAEISHALVAGDSSRSIAKRFETSASAIFRHRRHALTALVPIVEARREIEAETLLEEIRRLKADAQRLASKAEAEHDYRGALGAVKLLTDVALRLEELMPTGATETQVLVSFSFPPSGLHGETQRTNDPNENLSWNAEAATDRTAEGPDYSAIPSAVVPATRLVEPEERQPEEIVATKAPVPAPEPARPSPFQMLAPLGPGGRTR